MYCTLHIASVHITLTHLAMCIYYKNCCWCSYKRFRGFDQQDSHEVFRCLLDGLKMEEIKVFYCNLTTYNIATIAVIHFHFIVKLSF